MATKGMIAVVEEEIARLELVRKLLTGESSVRSISGAAKRPALGKSAGRAKRVLSPEARERIASAQRKRWAAVKRAGKRAARA
jgi:hypothetical protein